MTQAVLDAALREALARRLYGLTLSSKWVPYSDLGRETVRSWETQAEECLRQMEWARTGAFRTTGTCAAGTTMTTSDWDSLTLAPDEWKP